MQINTIKTTTKQIWIEYHTKLSAFIRARVSDDVITQDIIQDIFIKIHSQIATLKEQTKLESWGYQIVILKITLYQLQLRLLNHNLFKYKKYKCSCNIGSIRGLYIISIAKSIAR
jgi:hypothetical protein